MAVPVDDHDSLVQSNSHLIDCGSQGHFVVSPSSSTNGSTLPVSEHKSGTIQSTTSQSVVVRWPSVYCQMQKSKRIWKSVLSSTVAAFMLLVVWAVVILPTVFYVVPISSSDGPVTTKDQNRQINASNASETLGKKAGFVGTMNTSELLAAAQANMTCHKLLRKDPSTGMCYVPCDDWNWYTESEHKANRVAKCLNVFVPLVCGFIATITWIKLGTLWRFPHIIPFYTVQCVFVYGIVHLISFGMGRDAAYCGHKDMIQVTSSPTVFCSVSGAMFHYVLLAWGYWWVFGVANMWWIIVFPAKGRLFFDRRRTLHVVQSVFAWGIPVVIVGVVFAVDGHYTTSMLSPDFCTASTKKMVYYTYALPNQLNVGIGGTLLVWTSYALTGKIRKRSAIVSDNYKSAISHKNSVVPLQHVQRRLLLILGGTSIAFALGLINYMLVMGNSDIVADFLIDYLVCIHLNPGAECPQQFRQYIYTNFMLFTNYIWPTFFFFLTLFLLSFKDARQLWFRLVTCNFYASKKTRAISTKLKDSEISKQPTSVSKETTSSV